MSPDGLPSQCWKLLDFLATATAPVEYNSISEQLADAWIICKTEDLVESYNAYIEERCPEAHLRETKLGGQRYFDYSLRTWHGYVSLEHARLTTKGSAWQRLGQQQDKNDEETSTPTLNPATGTLLLNGRSFALESNEADVLKILVTEGAKTLQQLRSVCEKPNQVLSNLRTKYPALADYIFLPGKKGQGGYSTTIRPA